MPIVNGSNARAVVIGDMGLLGLIIVCMTLINVFSDSAMPPEFSAIATTLVGALAGFLAGTRVLPQDVENAITKNALADSEKKGGE
jgi:pyruvate kinase